MTNTTIMQHFIFLPPSEVFFHELLGLFVTIELKQLVVLYKLTVWTSLYLNRWSCRMKTNIFSHISVVAFL